MAIMRTVQRLSEHKRIAGGIVIILISVVVLISYLHTPKKTTYYIAYVGRYQSQIDQLQENLLKEYLDGLNRRIPNAHFELHVFSIKKTDTIYDSREAYQAIANDPKTVIVLDNTWGENLAPVIDLIISQQIPVISMNADRQNKDYRNQVAFIGYDDHVPEKITVFANKILRNQKQLVVAEDQTIFPSTAVLMQAFPETKSLIIHSRKFNSEDNAVLDSAIQQLDCGTSNERRTLLLNTHWLWGEKILHTVNSNCRNVDILGGPYIIDKKLKEKSEEESDEEAEKADEISLENNNRLILFTRSRDAVNNRVHHEAANLKESWPQVNTELFVERCIHAITIIEQCLGVIKSNTSRKNIPKSKQSLSKQSFVAAFKQMTNHTFFRDDGAYSEVYSFDNKLRLADDRIFEQYFNDEVSSYPQQLNSEDKVIPNIHIGVEDIQISSIDVKNSSFHAHFIFWWKCNNPEVDPNKYLFFRNQTKGDLAATGNAELLLTEEHGAEGKYQLFKVSGDFEMQADLTRYPLDGQEVTIELAAVYPRETVQVSFDEKSSKRLDKKVRVSSNEWDKEDSYFTVDNVLGESLGGNAASAATKHQVFETLNIRTKIRRNPIYSYITIIIPLLMIGLVATGVLYVRDSSFESIGHVCVVIFLAIATYRITFAELIPNAGHLTVADKLLFGAFVTIFIVFSKVIILNSGIVPVRFEAWIKDRTLTIGSVGLIMYCVMAVLALVR